MKNSASLFAAAALVTVSALPSFASAQRWHDRYDSRHAQKQQWKGLAVVGGVAGLVGLAAHNPTLTALGAAGAVYGGIRYEGEVYGDGRYGRYDRRPYDGRHYGDYHDRDRGGRWDDRRHDDRYDHRHGW